MTYGRRPRTFDTVRERLRRKIPLALDLECRRAKIFLIMDHLVSLTSAWFSAVEPRVNDSFELRAAFDLAKETRRAPIGLPSF